MPIEMTISTFHYERKKVILSLGKIVCVNIRLLSSIIRSFITTVHCCFIFVYVAKQCQWCEHSIRRFNLLSIFYKRLILNRVLSDTIQSVRCILLMFHTILSQIVHFHVGPGFSSIPAVLNNLRSRLTSIGSSFIYFF